MAFALAEHTPPVDLTRVRPYGDHLGDGIVQLSFTLPVPHGPAARKAALELAGQLGAAQTVVADGKQVDAVKDLTGGEGADVVLDDLAKAFQVDPAK